MFPPVGLYAFHVPLVDYCYDIFVLGEADEVAEDALVALVDEDSFLLRGDLVEEANQEVDPAAVD